MSEKIAVLSNVNMSYVIRLLRKEYQVYDVEGYGNELGILMNGQSSYHAFAPKITFLIVDLLEVLGHELDLHGILTQEEDTGNLGESGREEARLCVTLPRLRDWFGQMDHCILPGRIYYISDAWLWGPETGALPEAELPQYLETQWLQGLVWLRQRHENVRIFPYRQIIGSLGEENSFSLKTWYLGKILHTSEAQKRLAEEICRLVETETGVPKKVLLVDLDNTLWGGLAGEREHTPLELSEDHRGLAYKNAQRVLRLMTQSGVVLGIVSKNNEEDALTVIREHPHMVLREEDFVIRRINWHPKHENIREIADSLNLGLDAMVFWDDSPAERELVRQMLPQVEVPDFPESPEELASELVKLYKMYFRKPRLTAEDREKTRQYAQNEQRHQLEEQVGDFAQYLRRLQIQAESLDPERHMERLVQLVNKTNQFNLTTLRYSLEEMQKIVANSSKRVYLYRVEDCFGDYGIVSAAIVDLTGEAPLIEEWVMSCRVMGKQVEDALLGHMETDLLAAGYGQLRGRYVPTAKNRPVEQLYDRLGYQMVAQGSRGEKEYCILLADRPHRADHVTWMGHV
ncbi:MAG: HAD-IIIC family phosphatase [Lachnospiraceae bacterium]|nr:HAD-IIIC family phosphatase [Lachnospiraceae bacterium]